MAAETVSEGSVGSTAYSSVEDAGFRWVISDSVMLNTVGDLELLFLQKVEFHPQSIITILPQIGMGKQHCGICKVVFA